jgi:hypothetical protein
MRDRNDLEPTLDAVRDFDKILAFSSGMRTVLMPPRKAASNFSLRPAIGQAAQISRLEKRASG